MLTIFISLNAADFIPFEDGDLVLKLFSTVPRFWDALRRLFKCPSFFFF